MGDDRRVGDPIHELEQDDDHGECTCSDCHQKLMQPLWQAQEDADRAKAALFDPELAGPGWRGEAPELPDEAGRCLTTPRFEDLAATYLPEDPEQGIPRMVTTMKEDTMNGDDHKQGRLKISQEQAVQLQNLKAGGCGTRVGSEGWIQVLSFDTSPLPTILAVTIVGLGKQAVSADVFTSKEGWIPVDQEMFEMLVSRYSK